MTYGIIDRKSFKYYTYMSSVFEGIDHMQNRYNWLIADCICYPNNQAIDRLLDQEYCWLSGDELTSIIDQEDFQWIWGVLCGFEQGITLEDVLQYPIPKAEDYNGYYRNPISVQHPLASIEIVASDSSCTILVSKDQKIISCYLSHCPKAEDLSVYNQELANSKTML